MEQNISMSKNIIKQIEVWWKFVVDNNLLNDQVTLDTLDKLNEISVRY